MPEFDHLFICTDIGADVAADRLISWGLLEGSANTHPGQGTANRRFFFDNAMLELLWVGDAAEAKSPQIERMGLWERWKGRKSGACPFGICLRPKGDLDEMTVFSSWDYQPPYLPPSVSILVGTNSEIPTEPLLFQIPFGQRPDRYTAPKLQPLAHPVGVREITRVEVVTPQLDRSPELQGVIATDLVQLRWGEEYRLELGFDGEVRGQSIDFRSDLPLIISW